MALVHSGSVAFFEYKFLAAILHDTLQWMEYQEKWQCRLGVVKSRWQQVDAATHCLRNWSVSRPGEAMRVFCVHSWWLQCMRIDVIDAAAFMFGINCKIVGMWG